MAPARIFLRDPCGSYMGPLKGVKRPSKNSKWSDKRQVKIMVRLGGGSFRRDRLDGYPRPSRKPLEKSETEKKWLAQVPPGSSSGVQLERQKFKAAPKVPTLPPGFLPARACVVGDKVIAEADYGEIILEVVEVAPFMIMGRDIRTGRLLGLEPGTIVQVAI